MELLEIHRLYLVGVPVSEPWAGDDNFEAVLENDELEYDWRRIALPLAVVGATIDLSLDPNPGCDDADEAERFDWIREWGRESGTLAAALEKRPPAVVMDEKKAAMIDGRHRLALAAQEGLAVIPVIVGMPKGFTPAMGIEFPCYEMCPTATHRAFSM